MEERLQRLFQSIGAYFGGGFNIQIREFLVKGFQAQPEKTMCARKNDECPARFWNWINGPQFQALESDSSAFERSPTPDRNALASDTQHPSGWAALDSPPRLGDSRG